MIWHTVMTEHMTKKSIGGKIADTTLSANLRHAIIRAGKRR
jgi:hypothetical protein